MVFNGDTNDQDAVSDIDFWCSTNDNTYPLKSKVRNYYFGLAKTSARIMRMDRTWKHVSDNLTTIPIALKDVAIGQDNVSLETKHLKILRVRIIGKDGKLKTLIPADRNSMSNDLLNADAGEPTHYDKLGSSILPVPVSDYATQMEIEYQPGAAVDFPTINSTDWEPGFSSDFHRLPNLYASEDYCAIHARDRLKAIREQILILETLMDDYFEDRDIDHEPSFDVARTSKGASLLG